LRFPVYIQILFLSKADKIPSAFFGNGGVTESPPSAAILSPQLFFNRVLQEDEEKLPDEMTRGIVFMSLFSDGNLRTKLKNFSIIMDNI
jgi:hypothetical protein